jgi:MFS family permease
MPRTSSPTPALDAPPAASAAQNLSPVPPSWLPKAMHALTFRDFRVLWAGAFTSSIGGWMQNVAQAWLVYELTGSPFYSGLDGFLGLAPMLLFSLIGGAVADRMDRRKLLTLSQCVQMTTAFVLAGLLAFDAARVWHILLLSFITGTAQALSGPAYMALMPNLVPEKYVPNAVALNSIQFNLARVVGPAVAGVAMATVGPVMCFVSNGVSYVAVIASLLSIAAQPAAGGAKRESFWAGIRRGVAHLRADGALWRLCLLAFVNTALGISVPTLLPQFAKDVFGGDAALYSHLVSFSGVGAVVGGVVVASLNQSSRRGVKILSAQILFGISMLLFALSRTLWMSCVALFFAGALLVAIYSMVTALFQSLLSNELRGRLVGIYMLCFRGGMALGGLGAGALAQAFSPTLTVGVGAAILLGLGALLVAMRSPVSQL